MNINNMLELIDSNQPLTSDDIAFLILGSEEISRCYINTRQYFRLVESVVKIQNRYFRILWDKSRSPKYKDNYYKQPCEIMMNEAIDISDWLPINMIV